MIASLFSCLFFRISVVAAVLIMLPMIVDGMVQMFTAYESNNRRRFITGFLFGYGLVMMIGISTVYAFEYGVEIGRNIRK